MSILDSGLCATSFPGVCVCVCACAPVCVSVYLSVCVLVYVCVNRKQDLISGASCQEFDLVIAAKNQARSVSIETEEGRTGEGRVEEGDGSDEETVLKKMLGKVCGCVRVCMR